MAYNVNEDYETQLNEAEERIIELEKQLAEAKNVDASANSLHKHIVVGSALPELIPLLISYFYPTIPVSNSDEMLKKRLQIIEILNDLKAD